MAKKRDDLICGYGVAMADLMRSMHACGVTVKDLCDGHGFDLQTFKDAGLENYDMKELRKALK